MCNSATEGERANDSNTHESFSARPDLLLPSNQSFHSHTITTDDDQHGRRRGDNLV